MVLKPEPWVILERVFVRPPKTSDPSTLLSRLAIRGKIADLLCQFEISLGSVHFLRCKCVNYFPLHCDCELYFHVGDLIVEDG